MEISDSCILCWAGRLEVYGIIVFVKVGFLKLDICSRMLYSVLCIEMSKQFIVLFDSASAVKQVAVNGVKVCEDGLCIRMSRIKDEKNVIYVRNVFSNQVLLS